MQGGQSWVSLYSGEAFYAKALTLAKTPLSPNGVETKETAKSGRTAPERMRAPTQHLAKISSCSRSNRQAQLFSSPTPVPLPPPLSFSLVFSHYPLFVFPMPAINHKEPPACSCTNIQADHRWSPRNHNLISHNLYRVMTQSGAQPESQYTQYLDMKVKNKQTAAGSFFLLTTYLHLSLVVSLKPHW